MKVNPIQTWNSMSTGKKVATVAATAAVVGGAVLTGVAYSKGKKIASIPEGKEKPKMLDAIKEGYKKLWGDFKGLFHKKAAETTEATKAEEAPTVETPAVEGTTVVEGTPAVEGTTVVEGTPAVQQ